MKAPQKCLATVEHRDPKTRELIKTTEEWIDVIPKGICYDTFSYLDRKVSAIKLTSKSS
jgi:hypothetical protein